ncbi:MAG: dUTP diphosphatase [Gammaproteobacteria bacterium]|nr:dUTP diphosphatase [Gammaproteobacteria bacterium]
MKEPLKVKLKILDQRISAATLPSYATAGSAAMDLRVLLDENLTIAAGECEMLHTGLAIHLEDPAYAAIILPRSGLGHKRGLVLGNSVGLIDSDYQGELMISCWNRGKQPQTIEPNDRLAQLLIVPVCRFGFEVVEEFEESDRGSGGYGHTGTK